MIFIGMSDIERRLSRYPHLYSRIGFAHEFDKLSKDETNHIIEYKWKELGLSIKMKDFSDYIAITTIFKITGGNFRLNNLPPFLPLVANRRQMHSITIYNS
jgi:DNA transposition AAA+ family ATPase